MGRTVLDPPLLCCFVRATESCRCAQTIVEKDMTSLEIREVFPEDAGTYVVIAKNLGGESRTSCLLSLEGAVINGEVPLTGAAAPSRPIFIQPLQNKEVQEGSRAHLMCVVSGEPKPEVSPVLTPLPFAFTFTIWGLSLIHI